MKLVRDLAKIENVHRHLEHLRDWRTVSSCPTTLLAAWGTRHTGLGGEGLTHTGMAPE